MQEITIAIDLTIQDDGTGAVTVTKRRGKKMVKEFDNLGECRSILEAIVMAVGYIHISNIADGE